MTRARLPTALLAVFGLPAGLLVAPPGAQQDSALAGRWVANLEKSKRHANHQFESFYFWLEGA